MRWRAALRLAFILANPAAALRVQFSTLIAINRTSPEDMISFGLALSSLPRSYSDFKTLKKVFGFKGKSHRPTYALLNKAVALGFLIKHEYPVIAGKKSLWGITMQGLAMVVKPDDKVFPGYFEPGKLKYWNLEHRLLNHRVRIALEEKGGQSWLNGDRGEFMRVIQEFAIVLTGLSH